MFLHWFILLILSDHPCATRIPFENLYVAWLSRINNCHINPESRTDNLFMHLEVP